MKRQVSRGAGAAQSQVVSPLSTKELNMEELTPERLIAHYKDSHGHIDATLLNGVNTIDWVCLRHAHGAATDIPPLLRAVLSLDNGHRAFAFQLLHETIYHQGTIYQATSYVAHIDKT